ncbi:MAG: putative zinc-binding metallopeptidase [Pseudomonadota bacterium]
MRLYECPSCGAAVDFQQLRCRCGIALAYDPEHDRMAPLVTPCRNRDEIGCNWQGGVTETGYCRACAMTDVIPDTLHGENLAHWTAVEAEKRWVLAGLGRWGWFRAADPGPRPVFRLLAEETRHGHAPVMMGHAGGVITINVTEADPAERIMRREALGERLRTVTGHLRHELAHFLFARILGAEGFAVAFRGLFGDERADYGAALRQYYANGPDPQWPARHVTKYASAHPHEDWAECCAHILHLTDILDSALAAGLGARGLPDAGYDPYAERRASRLVSRAVRMGIAINHVTRSMGLQDLYPFTLTPPVRRKFAFAHRWLSRGPSPSEAL